MPRAEDEVLEPVRPGDEGVLVVVCAVDHAVARPHLVHLAVLPGEPGAFEDVEDLSDAPCECGGVGSFPGATPHAVQAHRARPGGVAEPLPGRVHLALGAMVPFDASQWAIPMEGTYGPRRPR